jgi:hypothetical protein
VSFQNGEQTHIVSPFSKDIDTGRESTIAAQAAFATIVRNAASGADFGVLISRTQRAQINCQNLLFLVRT